MAGERRLDRDLRRLLVANLADQHDVGIGAQQRAQPSREREPDLRERLHLLDTRDLVLDGVLDRRDRAPIVVERVERRVQRRRLARAGRPAGDDRAVRLRDRAQEDLVRRGAHAELRQRHLDTAAVQQPEHDVLAVLRRDAGDADVERLAADEHRERPVLRKATLGDVEPAHDLQPADHGCLHRPRDVAHPSQDAVDPRAHDEACPLGVEVHVRRVLLDRPGEHGVDEVDRRCLRRAAVEDVLERRLDLLDLVLGVTFANLDVDAVDPRERAVEDVALADGEADLLRDREPEVVEDLEVRRVGDGDEHLFL